MSLLDIQSLINNERQFTNQQKSTLLKCFAELADAINSSIVSVDSPLFTIDTSTTDGAVSIDVAMRNPLITSATTGGSTTIGVDTAPDQAWIFHSSGDMSTYTINEPNGGSVDGQEISIVFNHAVTTLTLSGGFWSSAGLTPPSAAIAGQCYRFSWDSLSSGWIRIQ